MARQIAIVTGASRGIGRGIALALGGLRWNVVVNYAANGSAPDAVGAAIKAAGGNALAVQGDVSIAGQRNRLVDKTLSTFGGIDLLVNNAGVAPHARADILEAGEESFDRLININLKGPYFLTQRVAKEMIRQQIRNQKSKIKNPHDPAIITISR